MIVFVLWLAVNGSWVAGGTFLTAAECNGAGGYVGYCQPAYVGPSTVVDVEVNQAVKGGKPWNR